MSSPTNIAASVRQRLLNKARNDQRPFAELLQYYAMERFLYRLSRSAHADRFVLKGALMLRVWESPEFRPTMDIDLLGITSNDENDILTQIREIMIVAVEEDGMVYSPDAIEVERITQDAEYEGLRIRFFGSLTTARIRMQVDIGFGDAVHPSPKESIFPTILDFPAPHLLCYSRESAIAEKFETMVKRGELNSRMKDFYDIWFLSRQFNFEGGRLAEAIRLTFAKRETLLPTEIESFSESIAEAKQVQWSAFRKKLQQNQIPKSFGQIVVALDRFLRPVISSIALDTACPGIWEAPGPWE